MNALNLGQWSAVATLVANHCPNPDLVAAVDAELEQARANTTATSGLSTEQASDWARMEPTETAPASAGNTPEGLAPQPNAPEGGWHQ